MLKCQTYFFIKFSDEVYIYTRGGDFDAGGGVEGGVGFIRAEKFISRKKRRVCATCYNTRGRTPPTPKPNRLFQLCAKHAICE